MIREERGQSRLIKVTVNSDKDKAAILQSCTHLRKDSTPSLFYKVYITPDLTPQQQLQNKILRKKLAEMNQNGKLYGINMARLCGGRCMVFPLHYFN